MADDVTLDIATKLVPQDQHIWAMFPGVGRRYLRRFRDEDVIFLETPGISLTPVALADDNVLRQHVAMSLAIADYHRGLTDRVPSRRSDAHEIPSSKSFGAAFGNVRNVFSRMKPGDLVLVGGDTIYEPILVGEIAEAYNFQTYTHLERFPRERIPTRVVYWLPAQVERRFLSQRLSLLLSNRRTVVTIDKEEFGEEIYKIAYGDYVFGEESRYIFEGPKYKNIAVATVPGINLITYFAAAFNACEIKELEKFSQLDIQSAIDSYFEQDILYSFEIDFRSPGAYILHAKRAALPLLVATLITATSGDMSLTGARSAEILNSAHAAAAGAPDACTLEIQEKYKAIMTSINADRFKELCKLNSDARHGVGLKTRIKHRTKKK